MLRCSIFVGGGYESPVGFPSLMPVSSCWPGLQGRVEKWALSHLPFAMWLLVQWLVIWLGHTSWASLIWVLLSPYACFFPIMQFAERSPPLFLFAIPYGLLSSPIPPPEKTLHLSSLNIQLWIVGASEEFCLHLSSSQKVHYQSHIRVYISKKSGLYDRSYHVSPLSALVHSGLQIAERLFFANLKNWLTQIIIHVSEH